MYSLPRFAVDVGLTLVISGIIYFVADALGSPLLYWIALLIAAVLVFVGELIWASSDGRGGWDWDL